jgi:hypothetical protein
MSFRGSWLLPFAALCVTSCLDRSPGEFKAGELPSCTAKATDADHDGHEAMCRDDDGKLRGDDCDDHDAQRHPGHEEVCDPDNRDEDCNPKTFGERDIDGDGYADAHCCNAGDDGKLRCGEDCYDFVAKVHPGAVELCDRYDNDCDGKVDERVQVTRYADADHDGHAAVGAERIKVCPGDREGAEKADDCDDDDDLVFPGMPEICDGRDNDCDGKPERSGEAHPIAWYLDADGDGFGLASAQIAVSCQPPPFAVLCRDGVSPELCVPADPDALSTPPGSHALMQSFAPRSGDCDDADPEIHPGAQERCNAADDDCDGRADFAIGVNDFEDDDGDGAADPACELDAADCDDREPRSNSQRAEICDELDNDCDGKIDEQLKSTAYYPDSDGDGYGDDRDDSISACVEGKRQSALAGDCDDGDPARNPSVAEICNARDDDCDSVSDEDLADCGKTLRLSGRVLRAEDARAVRGARVSAYDKYAALIDQTDSSASGLFTLTVPAGVVSIAVEAPAHSDLIGMVREIVVPSSNLVASLETASHWDAIAKSDDVTRDPARGLFVAKVVGATPAGGQGVVLGPQGGQAVSRAGSISVAGPQLPGFTPPIEAPFGQTLTSVTHYNLAPGAYGAMLTDVVGCQTFLVANLDSAMPPAGPPAQVIAYPVLANTVTQLRVDCSGSLGTCCSAHGERGCSDTAIEACVCAQRSSCCDSAWDGACANLVTAGGCSACSSVMPKADKCCSASDQPGCSIDEVQQCVCQVRPQCCAQAWDADCAAAVASLRCGLCPGADISASHYQSASERDAGAGD